MKKLFLIILFASSINTKAQLSIRANDTCMNFTPYIGMELQFDDDNLYPAGSTLMQTGDIRIIKPSPFGTGIGFTNIIKVNGDSLVTFIGNLNIDVALTSYTNKKLTFIRMSAGSGLVIDGDTICYHNSTPPATHNGNGFVFTYSATGKIYTITGDFDVVHNYGSTNGIEDVCLEENLPFSTSEIYSNKNEIVLYPNPASDHIQISINDLKEDVNYTIYDVTGKIVMQGNIKENNTSLNITSMEHGMYFIAFFNDSLQKYVKFVRK